MRQELLPWVVKKVLDKFKSLCYNHSTKLIKKGQQRNGY